MIQHYNLALLPTAAHDRLTALSQLFTDLAESYLLGDSSLPHLSLLHFDYEEANIHSLWQTICDRFETSNVFLELKEISCITFDSTIYWASLLPTLTAELMKMHALAAESLNLPLKKNYDPHLTLFNTPDKEYAPIVHKRLNSQLPVSDHFVLTLGKADKIGQLTEIIDQKRTYSLVI